MIFLIKNKKRLSAIKEFEGIKLDPNLSDVEISAAKKELENEERINGCHIFRFKEIPSLIIASEFLKEVLEKTKIIGVISSKQMSPSKVGFSRQ